MNNSGLELVDELKRIASEIFGKGSIYEKTREKLVGLTIPYSVSISESFATIVKKYIKSEKIQKKCWKKKMQTG